MSDNVFNRKMLAQLAKKLGQRPILHAFERQGIAALQLNTYREIITTLPPLPGRNPCMPGAHGWIDKLDDFAGAPDKKVG